MGNWAIRGISHVPNGAQMTAFVASNGHQRSSWHHGTPQSVPKVGLVVSGPDGRAASRPDGLSAIDLEHT